MIVNSVFDPAWYVTAGKMSEDPAPEDIWEFVFLISRESAVVQSGLCAGSFP